MAQVALAMLRTTASAVLCGLCHLPFLFCCSLRKGPITFHPNISYLFWKFESKTSHTQTSASTHRHAGKARQPALILSLNPHTPPELIKLGLSPQLVYSPAPCNGLQFPFPHKGLWGPNLEMQWPSIQPSPLFSTAFGIYASCFFTILCSLGSKDTPLPLILTFFLPLLCFCGPCMAFSKAPSSPYLPFPRFQHLPLQF